MIRQKFFRYHFDRVPFQNGCGRTLSDDGFILELTLQSVPKAVSAPVVLLESPGEMTVRLRDVSEESDGSWDWRENFLSLAGEDGHCPIIEILLEFRSEDHPNWQRCQLGVPLCLLKDRTVRFVYSKVALRIYSGDELLNEDNPFGHLADCSAPIAIASPLVKEVRYSSQINTIQREEAEEAIDRPFFPYFPRGFNTNAGDVVLLTQGGRLHMLYLNDRHHHFNRWGGGAHTFNLLTTDDLVNWTDYGPIYELTENWQSFGTGQMFYHKGKFYISFGWHTGRTIPMEKTATALLNKEYAEQHQMTPIDEVDLPEGIYPRGSSYAVSEDGIHYRLSHRILHVAENPAIYPKEDGTGFRLYCGKLYGADDGTWEAAGLDKPWRLVDPNFPSTNSPILNSGECPCLFQWKGYEYTIMGGTGFQFRKAGTEKYRDAAWEGRDIYDGLFVPMVATWQNDRRLLAGWIRGPRFGGCILLRELVSLGDGYLGLKWVPEIMQPVLQQLTMQKIPISGSAIEPASISIPAGKSFYLEIRVQPPKKGIPARLALRFPNLRQDAPGMEFQIDWALGRAQFAPLEPCGFTRPLQTLREAVVDPRNEPQSRAGGIRSQDGIHCMSRFYVIENLTGIYEEPFTLRLYCTQSARMRSTMVDMEIAGQRTMATNQFHLNIGQVQLAVDSANVAVSEVKLGL